MTQEEKELLIKDLSARLPYGVNLHIEFYDLQGDGEFASRDVKLTDSNICYCFDNGHWVDFKPYLRPMSSMTKEEEDELYTAMDWYGEIDETGNVYTRGQEKVYRETFYEYTDWLISHHFDFRGLIPMGLALEATEGMYD